MDSIDIGRFDESAHPCTQIDVADGNQHPNYPSRFSDVGRTLTNPEAFEVSSGTGVGNAVGGTANQNVIYNLWPYDARLSGGPATSTIPPSHQNEQHHRRLDESPPQTYARLLLKLRHGYPLWRPGLLTQTENEIEDIGARLGDVGFLQEDGLFCPLFNVCRPADDAINTRYRLPTRHYIPGSSICTEEYFFNPNTVIATPSILCDQKDFQLGHEMGTRPAREFSFASKSGASEGAFLVLPNGADRSDFHLTDFLPLETYARLNAMPWFKRLQLCNRADPACRRSLYLITGYDKCDNWCQASFSNIPSDTDISLSFVPDTINSGGMVLYRHHQPRAGYVAPITPRAFYRQRRVKNQSVFIRGYRITWHREPTNIPTKPVKVVVDIMTEDPSTTTSGGAEEGSASPPSSSRRTGFSENGGGNGSNQQQDEEFLESSLVEVESFPGPSESCHPLDYINDYLLSMEQNAQFAITHDHLLFTVIEDSDDAIPDGPQLLRRILEKYSPMQQAGCVTFVEKEVVALEKPMSGIGTHLSVVHGENEPATSDLDERSANLALHEKAFKMDTSNKEYSSIPAQAEMAGLFGGSRWGGADWDSDTSGSWTPPSPGEKASKMNTSNKEYSSIPAQAEMAGLFGGIRWGGAGWGDWTPPSPGEKASKMNTSNKEYSSIPARTEMAGRLDTVSSELLQRLPGWDLDQVRFDESKACLAGTRQQLLRDIQAWVQSTNRRSILWLSGGAGTGKSSVAHSCAMLFDNSGHLGGTFFFNRDIPKLNSPEYLITNLCYQLALFDHQLKERILSAIQSMGDIPASSLRTQARKLIVETTTEAKLTRPAVLVVDAVDEAGTPEMRQQLLEAIAEEFSNLPDSIKVIITCRDEYDIRTSLEGCSDEIRIESTEKTQEDIASYIQYRFTKMRNRARLSPNWPPSEILQTLYTRAERLFIWASVACNFVDSGRDHVRRLNELLDLTNNQKGPRTQPLSKLHSLYNRILETEFPIHDCRPADFEYVVGSIVVLEAPLTCMELDSLLGFSNNSNNDDLVLPDGRIIHLSSSAIIVNSLRSILREDSPGHVQTDGPVRLLHFSLYDFLTSHADDHLRINVIEQHHTLAIRCLQVMNSQLEFDICKIGDAALPNPHISETSQYISAGLRYSCVSFVYHITKVPNPGAMLMCTLKKWACENILQWIEAMSLLEAVTKAEQCLQNLATWLKDQSDVDELIKMLVDDVIAVLRSCGQGVRLSALQTYYSALALTPKTRKLYHYYYAKFPGIPDIVSSHPTWPVASVRILEGHDDAVLSVAFSPNGKKLASASQDQTLRLWDVESGQPIGDALKGHISTVDHAVFSPDGKKLASASFDGTLRLWDVESGQPIGDALKGHTLSVSHVVFSPDGKKLASASGDKTLRLWDVDNGQPIGDALKGHTLSVNHVVFSPDGNKLASSGSWDHTLRLWDVESGLPIGHALKGHTCGIKYVVFSPDGKKLASTSYDNTLCLWDAESGLPIGDALGDHNWTIEHVVFSPDGKTLVSEYSDNTALHWDVDSGQLIGTANLTFLTSTRHSNLPPLTFNTNGYLQHLFKRLLWLPSPLHGCAALSPSSVVVAVGSRTGAVTFIRWTTPISSFGMHTVMASAEVENLSHQVPGINK